MLNFLVFAVLAAAVVIALCWPVLKGRVAGPARADYDEAVFRDQLAELERDKARGLIGTAEAGAARNEIARRLIAAGRQAPQASPQGVGRWPVLAVAVTVPVAALGLYMALGAPGRPDLPLKQRLDNAIANNDVRALMAKAEAHLAEQPDDLRGWEVLAPLYRGTERYEDAAKAFGNILRLKGANAETYADYGEMLVFANAGLVPKEAAAAFAEALKLDVKLPKARFYAGLALKQDGKAGEALAVWQGLLADTKPTDSWKNALEAQIASLSPGAPQLSDEQVAATENMSPEDREKMIRGMVDGLEERLKSAPADLDGWQRLIRARAVLGEMDKARAAYTSAQAQFKDDSQAMSALAQSAKQLGIE
ncbi:c-type cytochrome biogenesis protein CcmI [Nordella sp. HKS 07]|uniref:c-type cytochrome biogenesis protein CcmI n=1 Tax=Nordella sp. HKS 07 TaxID=2712222 RepID=UPI0013E12AA6|nr:c-type cytochrome biogenesis protein CcmI [Nordella sp. HKS 07]QIG49654.1 c-type cytochrome biogenesis protein CcmI [Nordella sp. HKS 07]